MCNVMLTYLSVLCAAWQKSHHDVKHECWLFIVETQFCVLLVHLWTYCDHRQDINSIRICTDLESRGKCLNLEMKTFGSRNALIPEKSWKIGCIILAFYHVQILYVETPQKYIICIVENHALVFFLGRGKTVKTALW